MNFGSQDRQTHTKTDKQLDGRTVESKHGTTHSPAQSIDIFIQVKQMQIVRRVAAGTCRQTS